MQERPFGPIHINVPVIGQGTWNMEVDDRSAAIAALRAGMDAGLTHIDTAEMYGQGEVEELIAEAIRGRRDKAFLVSKVLPSNATYTGTLAACERSLRRLKTDHLDVYLLHWPGAHPLEETLRAFSDMKAQGKIRAFGVSNFDVDELRRAIRIAGPGQIACNQVLYHLRQRYVEKDLLPVCAHEKVALVAYSPFGSGHFPSPGSVGGKVLAEIGAAHQATVHQVALAFLIRHPSVFAIPKASQVKHAQENARAADLRLSSADVKRIDAAFPLPTSQRGLPSI